MKPTLIRLSSLALALLMLLPAALASCKPAPIPEETTEDQESITESLPIETETSEPDALRIPSCWPPTDRPLTRSLSPTTPPPGS